LGKNKPQGTTKATGSKKVERKEKKAETKESYERARARHLDRLTTRNSKRCD
jgi:hypothetical protein